MDKLLLLLKEINRISPSVKYQLSFDEKGRLYLTVPFDIIMNLGKDIDKVPEQLVEKIRLMNYVADNRDKLVDGLWPKDEEDKIK